MGESQQLFLEVERPELAHIVSIEKALEIALSKQQEREIYVKSINHQMLEQLKQYDQVLINRTKYSLPHVINISLKGESYKICTNARSTRYLYFY